MAIRFLQSFDTISLARDSQPADSLPPAEWAQCSGRKKIEKIIPKAHLTIFVKASDFMLALPTVFDSEIQGGLWLRLGEVNKSE